MIKRATGYLSHVSYGPNDAHIFEILASKIIKNVLGDNRAAELELVLDSSVFQKTWLASKVIENVKPINYRITEEFLQHNQSIHTQLIELIIIAKLINVSDFKCEHILQKDNVLFLIDCEATLEPPDSFEEMMNAQHGAISLPYHTLNKVIVKNVLEKFIKVMSEEKINSLVPYNHYFESKVSLFDDFHNEPLKDKKTYNNERVNNIKECLKNIKEKACEFLSMLNHEIDLA